MTPTTATPPAQPFLLPALIDPYVQPVASRSTPGLLHMVIRGDTPATELEVSCPDCTVPPGEHCAVTSSRPADHPKGHSGRACKAARTLVTRWYCTGTQRPHNGPHCRPQCVHVQAVRDQLEREETT